MTLIAVLFLVFLVSGMPLAFAVGISTITYFLTTPDLSAMVAAQRMISTTQSFPLLAVPFFIIAGNLMNASGITSRLVTFSSNVIGHIYGGLAQVSVILSMLMGGVSGSAVADATMQARILGPTMLEKGYSKGYTSSVICLSAMITATIPPSVGLIVFGTIGNVSVGRLFAAGIVPGLLMTLALMVPVYLIAKKRDYSKEREETIPFKEVIISFKNSIWALMFPLILIIGIRFGVFTPSEAGAFAVAYAAVVGVFVYKELNFKTFNTVLVNSVKDCGVVLLIMTLTSLFGYASTYNGLPTRLAKSIVTVTDNPTLMIFILIGFIFVAGMLMESTVNTMLFTPIFLPITNSLGIDPVHFGILMMLVVVMGGMTPPVGVAMYSVNSILDCTMEEYVRESIPFFIAIFTLIILMVFLPQIVLFLPNMIFG